jgi:hypothetical protein
MPMIARKSRRLSRHLLMCAVVLAGATAHAQPSANSGPAEHCDRDSSRIGRVQMRLVDAALKLDLAGLNDFSEAPIVGCLTGRGQSLTIDRVSLQAGRNYSIVAVCDEDCDDIDLLVISETGQPIGADLDLGADARVDIKPVWSGDYVVRVMAPGCIRSPACAFAIGIFVRRQP